MSNSISRRRFMANSLILATALATLGISLGKSRALSFDEYFSYDGLGLADLVQRGEVSGAELLELAIARTEQVNPSVNAVVEKLYERARAEAAAPLPLRNAVRRSRAAANHISRPSYLAAPHTIFAADLLGPPPPVPAQWGSASEPRRSRSTI